VTAPPCRRVRYVCLQATTEGQAAHAHVHEIIAGLRCRGWQVDLAEPAYHTAAAPTVLARLREFARLQWQVARAPRPDVLYLRQHFAAWPLALWARLRRVPVVQEVNGTWEDAFVAWPATRRLAPLVKWLVRTQLRWAHAAVPVTPALADWVEQVAGHRRLRVIPNAANTQLFQPDAPFPRHLPQPARYAIFVGALARWQGVDTMLAAIGSPTWPADVALVVVGDGVERPHVETAAAENPRLVYLGVQPYDVVPGLVAGSLLGLSVQWDERRGQTGLFPLKVFEYLAAGVPAVVSDYPGVAQLVRQTGAGWVVPPGDAEALAAVVDRAASREAERQSRGVRGRAAVVAHHSWDHRAGETAALLTEVCQRG